jgi:peptide deformylase
VWVEVQRASAVRVRARDGRGEEILLEAAGSEASVVQHEIDHLDGVLVLDRIPRDQRRDAMRTLREELR